MKRLVILSVLILGGLSQVALASTGLTPEQKKQVQQVVHDYLLDNPDILIQVSQKLQQQQEQKVQQVQKDAQKVIPSIAQQIFNDKNSPIVGNLNGSVTLVEFFDYQCPHCKDMQKVVSQLLQQNPNLRVIYKEFPIFGSNSEFAAAAALAANNQGKYQAFHDALMAKSDPITNDDVIKIAQQRGLDVSQLEKDMQSNSVKKELSANVNLAQKLQLLGTPAFIVAKTGSPEQAVLIPGTTSLSVLQTMIQQAQKGKLAQ